jgi:N-acetylmuramoyl-L-alanine amidase
MLSRDDLRLALEPGIRRVRLDGLNVYMNAPLRTASPSPTISVVDAETVLGPLLGEPVRQVIEGTPLVMLDPGHGGKDPGASGYHRTVEKRLALDIAKRVRRRLRRTGIDVALTREGDKPLTLAGRVGIARSRGADAFISIHLNASRNRKARGVETYVLPARGFPSTSDGTRSDRSYPGNQFDALNTILASYVQKGLVAATGSPDRGVRRARFSVLRSATFPAILVECGFVSNGLEAKQLGRRDYRDRIAEGIARGIQTYVGRTTRGIRTAQSGPETPGTGNMDREAPDRLPGDTARRTSAPQGARDPRPSGR